MKKAYISWPSMLGSVTDIDFSECDYLAGVNACLLKILQNTRADVHERAPTSYFTASSINEPYLIMR